jgi:soluble lytic murein transglycosylase
MKRTLIILLIICVILAIFSIFNIPNKILKQIYKKDYSQYVEKYSKQYNVDEELVYAVIKAESNFDEGATSRKGACGLMQLLDGTAREVAENSIIEYESAETLYNPEINIQLGIKYFSSLKKQFGCTELALAAYNAGSGNVTEWIRNGTLKDDGSNIENIPFKETNLYVRKVLNVYEKYKNLY